MSEKGARYFGLLDQALCNGNWSEIPELARKTDKHAPERKCFTLTARSEAQIASASHRPTSAESTATSSIHGLGELVPKLEKAIHEETRFAEDVDAARVCLAEIYWLREDAEKGVQALGQGDAASKEGGSRIAALGWLEVCEVKANLIRVAALESAGKEEEARRLYLDICQKSPGSRTPELRRWTERLLSKACMFTSRNVRNPTTGSLSECLQCFHAWSDFWSRAPSASSSSRGASSFSYLDIPRRAVWRAYYDLLSVVLQYNLLYHPRSTSPSDLLIQPQSRLPDEQYTSARRRQRAELKRVEATYESLLLDGTQFPKANQTNTEVEEWIQQVMANWNIFCSSTWSDQDLGDGGQQAVSRGALDILYRAATKTFHSTSILRCLFGVHTALGEFGLAMHAFDSYVELVDKAKARAAKSGKHELGFDSDDSVSLTASEAVRVLCRYGDREQGEKAIRVVKTIEAWLDIDKHKAQRDLNLNEDSEKPKEEVDVNEASSPNRVQTNGESYKAVDAKFQHTTLAAAYRAIGIAQAQWTRLTYETDSRSQLQSEALQNLRRAQGYDPSSIESAYALALVLAETGEVSSATSILKSTIAAANSSALEDEAEDEDEEASPEEIAKQRQLVPLWHLLALCLSAKDDYEQAPRMCASAFEQFGEPTVLFGEDNNRDSIDTSNTSSRLARGIVDQMDNFEKEGLVQVKMSQLALVELMEGAEAAVDVSQELLALYGRLFGNVELIKPVARPPPTAASATPSKLGGTLRSLAGSIRPRSVRTSTERGASRQASVGDARPSSTSAGQRGGAGVDASSIGVPISITVTNEDGVPTEKPHHQPHHFPFKIRGQHGDWRDHGNLKSSHSNSSMREKRSTMASERPLSTVNETPKPPAVSNVGAGEAEKTESRDGPASPQQPLGNVAHNAPHDAWPPPPGHKDQPPRQDVRLPAPHPSSKSAMVQPRLASAQDRQQKISLLVKIWLFIAGLYVRADLFEDAAGAVAEAEKLVESFESEIGANHASARRFFEKGWAGGKSVDGLWGDVWGAVSLHLNQLGSDLMLMSA